MPNQPRRIIRDVSDPSILVRCTECPWWLALRLDILAAYRVGEDHEIDVHGVERKRAEHPRRQYLARLELQSRRARHAATRETIAATE